MSADAEPKADAGVETVVYEVTASPVSSVRAPLLPDDETPPEIAGYEMVRIHGRGGMGVVWEAIEHRLKRRVALKVHAKSATPEQVLELWSEAQIAAKIGHPGIVAVHEFGYTLAGDPYYTMDFVEGTELRAVLRDGAMAPPRAIALLQEIASAVAAAHTHGVVHCDLKPGNVLVDPHGHVRILDFGLAVTAGHATDGKIRGSPRYMAPEQVSGLAVSAATDVYAIGLIFYEMLAGRRPFEADNMDELLLMVASAIPEPPSRHAPAVHADLDAICLRCLEKMSEDRYASASSLLEDLSAVLAGQPLAREKKPERKPDAIERTAGPARLARIPREQAKLHYKWTYALRSSAEKLWPFAANTERFNKAVGLPTAEFTDLPDPRGGTVRTGHIETMGLTILWDEEPFQWVKNHEHTVFRSYRAGPFLGLWNRVALEPRPDGGTDLTHEVWVEPRGLLGRLVSFFEVGFKAARSFRQVYRRMDDVLARQGDDDPFEPPHLATSEQRAHVERSAERVACPTEGAGDILERLKQRLLTAPTKSLERIRPYALADEWGTDRERTLEVLLFAAHGGLVEIAWDVVCPSCQVAHERQRTLSKVHRAGSCQACLAQYSRDLARNVELVFRPHPKVREVSDATYCAGSPAMRPHVLAQQIVRLNATTTFTVDLPRGEYRLLGPRLHGWFDLTVSPRAFGSRCEIRLDEDEVKGSPFVVKPGPVTFHLDNATTDEQIVRLELGGQREDAVTAAIAITHPSFHDFFSAELIAQGEHLTVGRMAFVFVEVVDRVEHIQQRGDADAFALFDRVDERVSAIVRDNGGASVDASLDVSIASFSSTEDAARAAIALGNASFAEGVELRVAVHEGHCIARTRSSRIDYFGETLQRGVALLRELPKKGVVLSDVVAEERAVARLVNESSVAKRISVSVVKPYQGRRIVRLVALKDA